MRSAAAIAGRSQARYTARMQHPVMCRSLPLAAAALAAGMFLITGCSQSNSPAAAAKTVTQEVAATQQLQLYHQMLKLERPKLAVAVGEGIISKYPDSPAAAEVRKALPELKAQAEQERLADLWLYQTEKAPALQYTATLDSSEPSGIDRQIQLILRRHQGWPQAVYLYGHGQGFVCKNVCDVVMNVDGKREVWKAYLPDTGDPAMLFKNDQGFIDMLPKTKLIEMDVTTKAHGAETLKFEVGGYDSSKFPQLPKK